MKAAANVAVLKVAPIEVAGDIVEFANVIFQETPGFQYFQVSDLSVSRSNIYRLM